METKICFDSAGITLRGTLHLPEGGGARPALIQCHGFGGSSSGAGHPELARTLQRAGYVVLRFDFRGCGESDGQRGSVICMEEVEDLRNAIGFLARQEGVDRERIGVIGASLGGAVVMYVAATDQRVRVCAASGAVGNGERRFRFQYPDEAEWKRFVQRLEEAKRTRERTGKSVMLHRYDIVLIPEDNRAGMPPGAIMEFTAETAMSMRSFNPEALVRNIAPRPLLLIHPRHDKVVPKSESEHLAAAAGQPCELHIIDTTNHFGSGDPELQRITLDWLVRYLPVQASSG